MFACIKEIETHTNDYEDNIYLTFDMDWCSDEVLSYVLDLIEPFDIKATFFVTHKTPLLERMRKNKNIELGIHPNFNFLLNGDFRYGKNMQEVFNYYKEIVPLAKSVRSHSMTQNSYMLNIFHKEGIEYDCNTYIPYSSQIELKPYMYAREHIIKVPYFWEDDLHCLSKWSWDIKEYVEHKGLKVFDFHPIHVFLNTESLDRYDDAKEYFNDFEKLSKYKNTLTCGIKDFLIDIIKYGKSR